MAAPRIAHTSPARWPSTKPGRFAATIRTDEPRGASIALLGLPDDTGVRLNGGRPGAASGPAAFREALAAFGTSYDGVRDAGLDVGVFDAGDVQPASGGDEAALFETHRRVTAAVGEIHALGLVPACVGGGHDLSLPSIGALARWAAAPVGGINVDAHLDVRDRVGSGMPFRRLIEQGSLEPTRFVELGLGRFVNEAPDVAWIRARGARLVDVESVLERRLAAGELLDFAGGAGPALFLSVDLDALDASVAPGVSALNPLGLGVRDVAGLVEAAGAEPRVRHFDLMELNPLHDVGGRTARVAAFLFLTFVAGFARRPR